MTISVTTARSQHAGSGSTGPFNIGFYFSASTELVVTRTVTSTGVETTLAVTTDYTLSGTGTANETLTLVSALAAGETLVIERRTSLLQETNLARGGKIDAETLEGDLDQLTRIAQDHRARLDRMPELYKDDTDGSGALNFRDNAVAKAGYVELKEATAPGTPASGYGRVYTKTDGYLYHKDDAGTETNISGQVALAAAQVVLAEAQVALAEAQVALATAQAAAAASSATDAQTAEDAAEAAQAAAEAAQAATEAALVAAGLPDDLTGQALKILQVNAGETGYQFATGGGDVAGPASSVDNEIALFDSTTGKLLKRASTTGLLKATSGVIAAASAGTDYLAPSAIANMLETDDIGVTVQAYDADTAKLDTAQTFTAVQKADALALTHNTAWSGAKQRLTVDVNGSAFTIANPTSATAVTGAVYRIRVAYTTSHSIAWGSEFKGVLDITPTATAGAVDHFAFEYNGTDFECIGYRLNAKVS